MSTPFKKLTLLFFLFPLFLFGKCGYFEPWGKDTDLIKKLKTQNSEKSLSLLGQAFDRLIIFHQKVISPIDGSRSHFRPTSSRYMQLAIHRYGFLTGFLMGLDRLLRENNEEWVYDHITQGRYSYKYDPATLHKKRVLR